MGEIIQFPRRQVEDLTLLPMAAGAEFLVGQTCITHYCEETSIGDAKEYAPEFMIYNADSSPWLRKIRTEAREDGIALHKERTQELIDGNFDDVILDVDAVGTAHKVIEIRNIYGEGSPEHIDALKGLELDCARKVAEASRKNSWEYFDPIFQKYNPETDQLTANGLSVDTMIDNGVSALAVDGEIALRIQDKVHHNTVKAIIKSDKAAPVRAIRFTPCPDWALESLRTRPKSAHGGYAPEVDKLMVHFDTFDIQNKEIQHEQVGVPGIYITPSVMQTVLKRINASKKDKPLTRQEIHNTIAVVEGEAKITLTDMLSMLDEEASVRSGKNIFLGEEVQGGHPKDYTIIYTEAQKRKHEQAALTNALTSYVQELEAENVDRAVATQMVERFMQEKLLAIAEKDPNKAAIIFDAPTAFRFETAILLENAGRFHEAAEMRNIARKEAPPSSSCGAGSCGLEGVDENSAESSALRKLLNADSGDTIIKDKVRPCKNCGSKSVVYAYTSSKVNKACTNCKSYEHKKTAAK